jgi:hypothetical protein
METDKSLRQRLNETFNRYHYVGIKNVLETPFVWTVALEQHEILNMNPADSISEDQMAKGKGGAFLPGDAATKQQQRVVSYKLAPGEKKMVPGEAAYVLVTRLYRAAMREKYGSDKAGLSKLGVPSYMDEMLPKIIVGPIVKNVSEVLNDFVGSLDERIADSGFTDVQANEPAKQDVKAQPVKK